MALAVLVFLASILLVILTARTFYLASKFRDLDDRVRKLERQKHETIPASTPEVAPSLTVATNAVASSVPATVTSAGSMRIVPEPPPGVVPPATPPEPPPPSRTREEWESLIGGRLLNRIGALALIIGVGFFLKYAIDNQWISELTRVLIGVGVGLLCLVGADRTRKEGFQIFSQGLVGAGIAILYLSVYASFNFYLLVSLPVAFVLMGIVTVVAFLEALRNDSLAVSLLACVGGFLTPFMLSTGESNEAGLFAYLIALDLGVILILTRKSTWAALEPLSLFGTYAIYFSWFGAYYTTAHTLPALLFLGLFWAIYHGLDLFRVVTAQELYADLRRAMAWLHGALSFGALYAIVIPHGHSQTALAAMIAVVFYVGSALFLERRRSGTTAAVIQYTLMGCTFLVWAIALQFERFTIVMFWTIEALLMVWMGTRYGRRYLWGAGLVLFAITALALLGEDGSLAVVSFEGYRTILNPRALAYVLLAAAVGVSAHFVRPALSAGSTVLSEVLTYGWILLLFTVLTVETNDLFRFWMIGATDSIVQALGFTRLMVLAGVWALSGLLLVLGGRTGRYTARPLLGNSLRSSCGMSRRHPRHCLRPSDGLLARLQHQSLRHTHHRRYHVHGSPLAEEERCAIELDSGTARGTFDPRRRTPPRPADRRDPRHV